MTDETCLLVMEGGYTLEVNHSVEEVEDWLTADHLDIGMLWQFDTDEGETRLLPDKIHGIKEIQDVKEKNAERPDNQ